jgi:hypothetical protein
MVRQRILASKQGVSAQGQECIALYCVPQLKFVEAHIVRRETVER